MSHQDYKSIVARAIRVARNAPLLGQRPPREVVQYRLYTFIGALEAGLEMAGDAELLADLKSLLDLPRDSQ